MSLPSDSSDESWTEYSQSQLMSPLDEADEDELPSHSTSYLEKSQETKLTLSQHQAQHGAVTKSGSNWTSREIDLLRVRYQAIKDPRWKNSPLSLSNLPEWELFHHGPKSLLRLNNKEIRTNFNAMSGFFIALANLLRVPSDFEGTEKIKRYPSTTRVRRQQQLPGKASPQSIRDVLGSSPPPQPPSSQESEFTLDSEASEDKDLDEELARKQAEVASSRLASEFISLAVDLFFDRLNSSVQRFAFKETPTLFDLTNSNNSLECKCFDDGSIVWHDLNSSLNQWTVGRHICSVETKPIFTGTDDRGIQMVPQYACELIGAVLQEWRKGRLNINAERWQPLIVTHSHRFTILSATFSPSYLQYIIGNEATQPYDDEELPFLDIHRTKTHDLSTSSGRESATKDLFSLCQTLRTNMSTSVEELGEEETEEVEEEED